VRVLLWIGSLHTGGAERQFSLLTDGLVRDGVETRIATLSPGGANWDWLAARHKENLISLSSSSARHPAENAWRHLHATLKLRRVLRDFDPDVIYSALYATNALAWLSTRAGGPPLVWGVRASDAALNPKRAIPFQFCRLVAGTVPLAIANAQAGKDYHLRKGFRPQRFEVVPNGIDTDHFRPDKHSREALRAEWGLTPTQRVIGYVARLAPDKGHEVVLTAAKRLVDQDPDVCFVFAGDGPARLRERLEAMASQMGLNEHVRWLGHRNDTASLYPAFDIFCSASTSEGFPNTVAEAMACGLGCVVSDVGDSAMIVGETGRVVPPRDPAVLAEALRWGLDHLGGGNGLDYRQRIIDEFSVSRMVDRTRELLESVSIQKRGTP
jgi:glycosyltransferase involved in cell wall biosynthesis